MNTYLRKCLQVGMLALSAQAIVFGAVVPLSLAADKSEKVSAKVGKPLKQARDLMNQRKWQEALEQTRKVAAIPGKSATEEAVVNEMLAYCMMNLKDYAGAAAVYETMLANNQFKTEDAPKRLLSLSQLYLSLKNYPKAIEFGERYLKENSEDLSARRQISESYYLNNDYSRAEIAAQQLIQVAEQTGARVEEDWLKLLLSAQYKQDKKSAIVQTLERLLIHFPSDQYWTNMLTYASDSSFSDRQIMIYLRLLHDRGLMGTNEYIEMAELSLAVNSPGDAKAYLEEGFSKGKLGVGEQKDREVKLLSLARQEAATDVTSLPALEKEASAKPTGDALTKIGEAYLGHGQYREAITAFERGLKKGGIHNLDDTYINTGIAHLKLGEKDKALAAFHQVPATSKMALVARLWSIHAGEQG